jgi:hypothetical protein
MDKTFPEAIKGIRSAVVASEVREDIAQMGEYVEQFANTATAKAKEAAASAEAAGGAVQGVRSNLASEISRAEHAERELLAILRLLAAGNDAAAAACDRLEALWGADDPDDRNTARLSLAVLGRMILGRS